MPVEKYDVSAVTAWFQKPSGGVRSKFVPREDRRAGPKGYPDLRANRPVRIRTPEEGGDGYEIDQERKDKQKRREERAKA